MVAILLHVLPYQGWHPDGVDLSSGRMQLSSHIRVCEGKPNSPWTLIGIRTVLPCRLDRCTGMLESSRTLKSIRTCCHDVRTDATLKGLNLLDTDGSLDGIAMSSKWMLLTDELPDALLGSEKQRIQNFWFGNCIESSWNFWNSLLHASDTELVIIRLFPSLEK